MERIICDSFVKDEVKLWDLEPESVNTKTFNRKILAVNNMYMWLYEQGILDKIAFEMKDYTNITYFAFDVKNLEPYRNAMENCGVEDAAIAVQHIFDEKYSPCLYSGAIELTWTMFSYRDIDGTVGRSWECELCRHLNAGAVLDVGDIKEKQGVKAAVKHVFELSGFEPSNAFRVRALTEEDVKQVAGLDELSGNSVADMLDCEEYAWGVFAGQELIGYCTIGGAEEYDDYAEYKFGDLLLSDVFVKEEFRSKGVASALVEEVLSRCVAHNEKVFITILDDNLAEFYKKLGFVTIDALGGTMVRDFSPCLEDVIQLASNKSSSQLCVDGKEEVCRDER